MDKPTIGEAVRWNAPKGLDRSNSGAGDLRGDLIKTHSGTIFQRHIMDGELPPGQLADDVNPLEIVTPVRLPLASSFFESSFCHRRTNTSQRLVSRHQMCWNTGEMMAPDTIKLRPDNIQNRRYSTLNIRRACLGGKADQRWTHEVRAMSASIHTNSFVR
ncbi:hypothetical protein CT0861_04740 [Colletotrichum tofieldiae]|uniref:Uncharacterized protein n=1 Tax=Colletotrichum tofieldiae TaxID=708197 RepID=A0A166RN62_9PEZI|nr:hypothetical protein CT0861_04740 [Colletotrichum tofieldiae]